MESEYYVKLDERLHAIAHVQNIEHEHDPKYKSIGKRVRISIRDDLVLAFPWIKIGQDGELKFAMDNKTSHIGKPVKDENGNYIIRNQVDEKADGVPKDPCEVETERVYIGDRISAKITDLIENDRLVEPVDISDIVTELYQYYLDIKKADPLVEKAEAIRSKAWEIYVANKKEAERINHEEYVRRVEQRQEETRLKEEREAREEDEAKERRLRWIQENGSDLLKAGVDRKYTCLKKFLREWRDKHLGEDWVLDFNWKIEEQTRRCPSDEGLQELLDLENVKVDGIAVTYEIVWLPNGFYPVIDNGYDEGEPCEAIKLTVPEKVITSKEVYFYKAT